MHECELVDRGVAECELLDYGVVECDSVRCNLTAHDQAKGDLAERVFAKSATTRTLEDAIVNYWDERSSTYSNGIWDELNDAHYQAWRDVLTEKLGSHARMNAIKTAGDCPLVGALSLTNDPLSSGIFSFPDDRPLAGLKVLDLGCGPGFFEILLSQLVCHVHAVDCATQMLERACENVSQAGRPDLVEFFCGDIGKLPFDSDVYDVVISRNVTWLMRDPVAAYAEWQRVLKPGGKLLVFDANWYTYLADEALDRERLCDQLDPSILNWGDRSFASTAQERRCEAIARELPHTYHQRPSWDEAVLKTLGFTKIVADELIYRRVWNEGEQAFYATSPLFAIEATKACGETPDVGARLSERTL